MKKAIQPLVIVLLVVASLGLGALILRLKPATPDSGERGEQRAAAASGAKMNAKADPDAAGRVELSAAKLKNAGVEIAEAGPARITTTLRFNGKVTANEDAVARVMARFPGIVKAVRKRLGDPVAKGETLAVVESNDSLRSYEVRSEIAGTVTAKDTTLGELVNDQKSMFTVADLSSVWVDLNVYREDFRQLKVGQKVFIDTGAGGESAPIESEIAYLSPFGSENTQSLLARAVVPNVAGALRPGLFVSARVVLGEAEALVAVKVAALQTLEQKTVVFVREGDAFEARPVEVGRRDGERVEITAGVQAGERYAAANSFVLKAEIGKDSAHEE